MVYAIQSGALLGALGLAPDVRTEMTSHMGSTSLQACHACRVQPLLVEFKEQSLDLLIRVT